jgi:hypothetical protein
MDFTMKEAASPRVGLLGELEVELRLAKDGWQPLRLDTAQMASNTDLLAIKKRRRISIQVKTTDLAKQRLTSEWLFFGYSTGYLRDRKRIFNSKESPLTADVIVGVGYKENASRFIVMPVAFAERLCRLHATYWSRVPAKKRTTGRKGKRSVSFPIYLALTASPKRHSKHHERMKRNIKAFEGKWEILNQPIDRLHDRSAWPVLR